MSDLSKETEQYKSTMKKWIEAIGLPQYQPDNQLVEDILSMDRESLRQKSSVELSEDAYILSQYAFFLQQKTNECTTFLKWSKQVINRIVGDDRAELHQWIKQADLRIERIQYLTRRIEVLVQTINGIARSRYNEGVNR